MFCSDRWIGESPFADQFPALYNCTRNKHVVVQDCVEKVGDHLVWNLGLNRRQSMAARGQLETLLSILQGVSIKEDEEDNKI